MKELTINQEAGIYQAIYKMHVPNYIPNFYTKKNYKSDEYDKYLSRSSKNEPIFLLSEYKSSENGDEEEEFSYSLRSLICDICGRPGHDSKNCKKILSINDIELSIKSDIKYAEMKIKIDSEKKRKEMSNQDQAVDYDVMNSKIYNEDYFGLYVVNGGENEPIENDGSLEKDLYCINCGKKGHIFSNCQKPTLSKILENVEISNNNNNSISPMSVKNKFDRFWNHPNNH